MSHHHHKVPSENRVVSCLNISRYISRLKGGVLFISLWRVFSKKIKVEPIHVKDKPQPVSSDLKACPGHGYIDVDNFGVCTTLDVEFSQGNSRLGDMQS